MVSRVHYCKGEYSKHELDTPSFRCSELARCCPTPSLLGKPWPMYAGRRSNYLRFVLEVLAMSY